ncbi:MAG TPA: ATP-binding protein [Steroidobacteraceae bacterium]|nr:ATP-binding protein [Steroidobacteraceae bacterium]
MRRLSNRLLVRTALLFALLLIVSQVIWIAVGSLLFLKPVRVGYVTQLATYVMLARSALASMPRDARPAFLEEVNRQSNIRVVPIHPPYGEAMAPDREFPPPMAMSLRNMAGNDVSARMGSPEANTWIRFVAAGQPYWLVVSPGRPPFPVPLLTSIVIALVVSTGGAYLLIARLNRRLHAVVQASRAIGRGEIPAAIAVEGPDEIQELSRGFNQMSEGLQRLDADRRLMLAGISHDLRSPLGRLRLNVELSESGLDSTTAGAMVRDIKEIDAILGQFLEFARDESDEPAQQCDLNAIVSEICEGYRLSGHDVRAVLGPVELANLRAVAVRRLITNLVDNGVRYAQKQIEVATSRTDDDQIVLTVADRGPGIRSGSPDALIKPFAREDDSRSRPGSGLGLTLVDRIARAHGGSVKLMNRPDGGLLVVVTLAAQ